MGSEMCIRDRKYIVERSEGKSLQANIALALNNVRVGIKIAKEIVRA